MMSTGSPDARPSPEELGHGKRHVDAAMVARVIAARSAWTVASGAEVRSPRSVVEKYPVPMNSMA